MWPAIHQFCLAVAFIHKSLNNGKTKPAAMNVTARSPEAVEGAREVIFWKHWLYRVRH
jgi:hypothetical protein